MAVTTACQQARLSLTVADTRHDLICILTTRLRCSSNFFKEKLQLDPFALTLYEQSVVMQRILKSPVLTGSLVQHLRMNSMKEM